MLESTAYSVHALALVLAGLAAVLGLIVFIGVVRALRQKRLLCCGRRLVYLLLLLPLLAVSATAWLGLQGFHAFNKEQTAAVVVIEPLGQQQFLASLELPDGEQKLYRLHGDQFTVEAYVLKWEPFANLLGFHTYYQLDRLTGRYQRIEDERDKPRSVYPLHGERWPDLVALQQKHQWLTALVDAEYGSSTFIKADRPGRYAVQVSTSGLLLRELPDTPQPSAPSS